MISEKDKEPLNRLMGMIQDQISLAIQNEVYCRKKGDKKGVFHYDGRFHAFVEVKEMILNTFGTLHAPAENKKP